MGAFFNRYMRFCVSTATILATILLTGCEQEMALLKAFRPWNYSENPATYYLGKHIKDNVPSLKGESYSISPALSAGLNFDAATGIISGTPSALRPATDYNITLSNSAGKSNVIVSIFVTEDEAPVITSFSTPATYASLTVPINSFTATDNIGVTGYCIVESNNSSACNWEASAQTSHTFTDSISPGSVVPKILYAFARDAAGNISLPASSNISILGAINGICGPAHASIVVSAPSSGFCSGGAQTSVSGTGPWSWSCVGSNSGTSINCQAELKGACGATNGIPSTFAPASSLCSLGSASSVSGGALSSSPWTWSCTGSAGAPSAVSCQAPVQGACGSANNLFTNSKPASNLCNSGTASAVSGSGPLSDPWKWSCSGSTGGGSPASCSTHFIPVSGACGSANGGSSPTIPTSNLCSSGTATSVTGSGPWNWSCSGANGGSTANCASTLTTYSVIFNSSSGGSLSGSTNQIVSYNASTTAVTALPSSGYSFVNWTGTGGFVTKINNPLSVTNVLSNMTITANFAGIPVNGACGSANGVVTSSQPSSGLCNSGTASTVSGYILGSTAWSWSCSGIFGGSNSGACSAPLQGACGAANGTIVTSAPTSNFCNAGAASGVSGSGPWSWTCTGSNSLVASCSAHKPSNITAKIDQVEIVGNSVTMYVSVANLSGVPVTGLTVSNFAVREQSVNQSPITVSTPSLTPAPISVSLSLDYSGSMTSTDISNMQTAASSFVNQMGATDEANIVKYSSYVDTVQAFTSDKVTLNNSISASWAGAMGSTALYDGIIRSINDTAARSARKAVIAMTDGGENASSNSLANIYTLAACKRIPVFTVGLGSADATTLQNIATNTGGEYYYAPSSTQLATIYSHISTVFSNQYIVKYTSSNFSTPANRSIEMDVTVGPDFATATKAYAACP